MCVGAVCQVRRQPSESKAKALCLRLASSPLPSYIYVYNTFTAQFQNLLRFVQFNDVFGPCQKEFQQKCRHIVLQTACACPGLACSSLASLPVLSLGWPLQPLELPPSGSILAPSWHLACQRILHILLFIINFHSAAFFPVVFLPLPSVRRATSTAAAAASSPRRFQFSGCPPASAPAPGQLSL